MSGPRIREIVPEDAAGYWGWRFLITSLFGTGFFILIVSSPEPPGKLWLLYRNHHLDRPGGGFFTSTGDYGYDEGYRYHRSIGCESELLHR